MEAYDPVEFEVVPPIRFARVHVALRVLLLIVLGAITRAFGGLPVLVYLFVPVIAAAVLARVGPEAYRTRAVRALRWAMGVCAYFGMLTDELPTRDGSGAVRLEVASTGTPTIGSSLLRLITSLPLAFLSFFVAIAGAVAWIVSAFVILVDERQPRWAYRLQTGVARWTARVLAYHLSLLAHYPPLGFAARRNEQLPA